MTVGGEGPYTPLPVFVDVDTGVDDAMALVYLFASKRVELIGIASTAGNVPVEQVCRNNLGLLELCQITGVHVSKGAEQPVSTPLRTAEDTTGPLTNLALALRREPALPKLLRRLVIMGGSFDYRGNTTPVAEWNISVDPEAAAEVFAVWGAAWGLSAGRSEATGELTQPSKHLPIVLGLNLT